VKTLASCTLFAAFALGISLPGEAQILVPLNPASTYLRISPLDNTTGPVFDSVPFSLEGAGIQPGDVLHFDAVGGYSFAVGQPDTARNSIAVFSSSDVLLSRDQQFRVPGAIAAGTPFVTPATFFDGLPTDISEDFNFGVLTPGGVTLTVPTGARFLFFSVPSSAYNDNTDPNRDYFTRITVISQVPEPGSVALFISAMMAGGGLLRKRRKSA
jgi:hypothetical protein